MIATGDWGDLLGRLGPDRHDIYYTPEYVTLYSGGDVTAHCYVREDDGELYMMPFLKHPNRYLGRGRFDISTPYGYGGPVSSTDDAQFIEESSRAMLRTLEAEGAVAGFLRCHPLLDTHERLTEEWNVEFDRQTVGCDLRVSEQELWELALNGKGRNRVRKAEAAGVDFEVDDGFRSLDDFVDIYYHTMKLVDASPFYFFDRAYFEAMQRRFGDRAFVARVTSSGTLVAAMLFLCDGNYAHAHLSGSRAEFRGLGPNNFLVYNAMLEAKRRGCSYFHLGGGTSTREDDHLLRFKTCFSRERFEFHVGRTVFDRDAYEQSIALHSSGGKDGDGQGASGASGEGGRFPAYGLMGPAS